MWRTQCGPAVCGGPLGPRGCRWTKDNVIEKSQGVSLQLSLKKDILQVSMGPVGLHTARHRGELPCGNPKEPMLDL